jgi:AmmeMemoRadiSam system protein B
MTEQLPRMRDDVELLPMSHAGRPMVLVRDPLGLIKEPVALDETGAAMLAMLDGSHTMSDLKLLLARSQGGILVTTVEVTQILEQLSAFYLLQDERYERARAQIVAAYAARPVRTAYHAGVAYSGDPEELKLELEDIMGIRAGGSAESVDPREVVALVAPHMDLRPAAACYAAAYGAIRGAAVDLAVILGTGHSVKSGSFALTMKDFETPLGTAKTDKRIVQELADSSRDCVPGDDLPHRHEHSIEFQVLFLQYVLGNPDLSIVPILCGSLRGSLDSYGGPSEIPCVGGFLAALRGVILREKRSCLIVAGVDFSHVGIKFGDSYSGRTLSHEAAEHDKALLDRLCACDAAGFWQESRRVKDAYKVCGFAPMASMLELLPAATGHFLDYGITYEDATHSAVSYAAAAFTRK